MYQCGEIASATCGNGILTDHALPTQLLHCAPEREREKRSRGKEIPPLLRVARPGNRACAGESEPKTTSLMLPAEMDQVDCLHEYSTWQIRYFYSFHRTSWSRCFTRLLRTREVPGSNLGLETGYPDWGFSWFSSVPPGNRRVSIALNWTTIAFFRMHSNSSFTYYLFIRLYIMLVIILVKSR
jgi:hypothetical protein